MLLLQDLKGKSKHDVYEHLVFEYQATSEELAGLDLLIGYESVGNWGCDSESFFLFRDDEGNLFEVNGSHCSCFGFEGQFKPEHTTAEALKFRIENGRLFFPGGYDVNEKENLMEANEYIIQNILK